MIIVVGGTKGGTGKSTLVTNLAAIDVNQGHDSLLVDADRQGSASAWAAAREEAGASIRRVPSVQKFGQLSLTNELKALTKKYDNVFVDAGGYDSEELRAAILAADRLYIPLRPAQFDVWTLPKIIEIAAQSQMYNPELQCFFDSTLKYPFLLLSLLSDTTHRKLLEIPKCQESQRSLLEFQGAVKLSLLAFKEGRIAWGQTFWSRVLSFLFRIL